MARIVWQLVGNHAVDRGHRRLLLVDRRPAAVAALIWGAQLAFREIREEEAAEARRQAAVARRADQQHAWVLAGDDRGVYGAYPPAPV